MNNAIAPYVDPAIEDVKRLANLVLALRNEVFIDGQDYGTIPGTGDKPTLLLPGMEKLMRAMRLRPEYIERLVIRDYDKPLFHYEYECRLVEQETNLCVSTAVGLATSHESKWRWREAKRVCPNCGAACINRSKFPPKKNPNATPGWYCFAKQGGCGAEFAHDDPAIMEQTVGRIENPDIFDQVNTIAKIAQKRALASAIKGAANVSEFFTVDLDDLAPFQVSAPPQIVVEGKAMEAPKTNGKKADTKPTEPPVKEVTLDAAVWVKFGKDDNQYYVFYEPQAEHDVYSFSREPFRAAGWDVEDWLYDSTLDKGLGTQINLDRYPTAVMEQAKDGYWHVKHVSAYEFAAPYVEEKPA